MYIFYIVGIRDEFNKHAEEDGMMPTEKLQIVMRGLGHRLNKRQLAELMSLVDKDSK